MWILETQSQKLQLSAMVAITTKIKQKIKIATIIWRNLVGLFTGLLEQSAERIQIQIQESLEPRGG